MQYLFSKIIVKNPKQQLWGGKTQTKDYFSSLSDYFTFVIRQL